MRAAAIACSARYSDQTKNWTAVAAFSVLILTGQEKHPDRAKNMKEEKIAPEPMEELDAEPLDSFRQGDAEEMPPQDFEPFPRRRAGVVEVMDEHPLRERLEALGWSSASWNYRTVLKVLRRFRRRIPIKEALDALIASGMESDDAGALVECCNDIFATAIRLCGGNRQAACVLSAMELRARDGDVVHNRYDIRKITGHRSSVIQRALEELIERGLVHGESWEYELIRPTRDERSGEIARTRSHHRPVFRHRCSRLPDQSCQRVHPTVRHSPTSHCVAYL